MDRTAVPRSDEAVRALNKQSDSGYVAPAHLFVAGNIGADGGPENTSSA